jgi:hypothetical protein
MVPEQPRRPLEKLVMPNAKLRGILLLAGSVAVLAFVSPKKLLKCSEVS